MEADREALEISGYSRNRGGPKKYEQEDTTTEEIPDIHHEKNKGPKWHITEG